MTYELVDRDSFNLVGSYDDQDVALLAVLETANRNGDDDAAELSLAAYDDSGKGTLIAQGYDLVHIARARWQAGYHVAAAAGIQS